MKLERDSEWVDFWGGGRNSRLPSQKESPMVLGQQPNVVNPPPISSNRLHYVPSSVRNVKSGRRVWLPVVEVGKVAGKRGKNGADFGKVAGQRYKKSGGCGKVASDRGKKRCDFGKVTPKRGKNFRDFGKVTGKRGKIISDFGKTDGKRGKKSGGFGKVASKRGKKFGDFGKVTGKRGKNSGDFGKIAGQRVRIGPDLGQPSLDRVRMEAIWVYSVRVRAWFFAGRDAWEPQRHCRRWPERRPAEMEPRPREIGRKEFRRDAGPCARPRRRIWQPDGIQIQRPPRRGSGPAVEKPT